MNQVFWLAVVATIVGFGFLLWAVMASLEQPQITGRALAAGIAGAISQFVGATFLVIYKSIMAQANGFISVLERINTVGMAVQILDSIPESQAELKNETRSNLVSLLLSAGKIWAKSSHRSRESTKTGPSGERNSDDLGDGA